MEIYNETMFDLLSTLSSSMRSSHQSSSYSTSSLQVIEDDQGSVYVRGLSRHLAQNEEDALNMLFEVTHHQRRDLTATFHFLVHGQVTIIFVVTVGLSVCLFVCLCRVFLGRL